MQSCGSVNWADPACPITRCKSLLNGPCGGAKDGKCEINSENDCAWILIYNRLKEMGKLDTLLEMKAPKDYSKSANPKKLVVGK